VTLIFLATQIRLVRSPLQRDYGEGHVLWLTNEILNPTQAYKAVDALPYVVYPYTPLYMLSARLANLVFPNQLATGRSLSLLSTLGIGAALAWIVAFSSPVRATPLVRLAGGAFAGVLPFLMDGVQGWCSLMRVDMLGLFLMYAGLAVYITLGQRARWQYGAAVLFVLALFTKQTMLSAPLACLSFGLFIEWKGTVRVASFAVALLLAVAWLLNSITHGGFLTNIIGYNANPFSWKAACILIYNHMRDCLPRLAIAAATFLAICNITTLRKSDRYNRAVLLAGLNSCFALAAMISIGKMGAIYNHFLAWDVSICLLCGLFLLRLLTSATWQTAELACLLLTIGLLFPATGLVAGVWRPLNREAVAQEAEIKRMIRQTPGPVFSENLLLLIESGRRVEVEPATVTFLALSGGWDERPYVHLFDRQYFGLLVANDIHFADRYTPAVTAAIERSYVREQQIGEYSIYRPIQHASAAR
jgi:hypothetical protein